MHRALLPLLSIALALAVAACASTASIRRIVDADTRRAAQAGRVYAEDHCASCHAIERGATASRAPSAPAFKSVADTQGMTATALQVWLRTPHETMPDFIVPDAAIDDLAAYLASLKTQG
jgi:mono/diheme cytochrome c family protein